MFAVSRDGEQVQAIRMNGRFEAYGRTFAAGTWIVFDSVRRVMTHDEFIEQYKPLPPKGTRA